ncbi:MAG: sulfatase-like hydrolase/transferase, partial [bacterium]|nr:sulfatase-like hydrolase/transferase [bacterium]
MNIIRSLTLAALFGPVLGMGASAPNVVLILTDDQGWTGTSVQLNPNVADSKSDFYRTPALERLSREGMRFSNAYAPHPNCSPTRLAIQTGKSPAQLRMTDIINRGSGAFYEGHPLIPPQHINALPHEELTIAELIKAARPEYATAHFGKWHLAGGGPGEHGYDFHDGPTGNRDGNRKIPLNPKRISGVTRRAGDFLTKMAQEKKPFYLQISHYAVHLGIETLDETVAKYAVTERGVRHNHPGHAAMTEDLDSGIGRVLEKIDELGLAH